MFQHYVYVYRFKKITYKLKRKEVVLWSGDFCNLLFRYGRAPEKDFMQTFFYQCFNKATLNNNNKFSSVLRNFLRQMKFHTGELLGSLKDLHHQHSVQYHIFDKSSSVKIWTLSISPLFICICSSTVSIYPPPSKITKHHMKSQH